MRKIISKIMYHWWIYLLVTIMIITIWTSIFKNLKEPSKNEKITISYFGMEIDNKLLRNDLEKMFKDNSPQIKKISVINNYINDNKVYFKQLLLSQLYQSDIIIVDANYVDNDFGSTYFKPINKNLFSNYCQDITYYIENNKEYGILLSANESLTFKKYCLNSCYLFVSPSSHNVASMYGTGNEKDDYAIKIISYLASKD